jgi:peptidoglycan/LPS O-acetylase OafA/YrhL
MKYNPALDGIRALAVLAVIGVHSQVPGMDVGRLGVDLFFVLSGFLITSLLKAEAESGGIRLGAFYLRRVRRLYPALLVLLAIYALVFPLLGNPCHWRDVLIAGLYLSDYAVAFKQRTGFDPIISHTWSLSVEEHFYLLWPLIVIGLTRLKWRALPLLFLAYALATFWRLYASHLAGDWWVTAYRFDTRVSGLILGAILAYLPRLPKPSNAIVPLALVLLTFRIPLFYPARIIVVELLAVALIGWAMSGKAKLLEARPLVYLGRISYGIYLFHFPIAWLMARAWAQWWEMLPVVTLGSIVAAHLSYTYIESRFRSVRRVELRQPHPDQADGDLAQQLDGLDRIRVRG